MSALVFESASRSFLQKASRSLNGDGQKVRSYIHTFPAENLQAVVDELVDDHTEVLAIGPDLETKHAIDLARLVGEEHPEVSVVLVAKPEPQLWEPALRAGVADVVAPESNAREIEEVFRRVLATAERRRKNLVGDNGQSPSAPAAPSRRIVTVVSPKGGAGKTLVSTNLAMGLALSQPNSAVLVDLDLEFGDVSTALLLEPEHTIYDAIKNTGKVDKTTLKVFLTPHASNLYTLCAPLTPEEGEAVTPEGAGQVLNLLSEEFPFLVIDTGGGLSEHTLTAIEHSTDVVFVTALDVSSVRGVAKAVQALDQLGMTKAQRHLVLNRANSRVGLAAADVEEAVGLPVGVSIPSSRDVPVSMNEGVPLVYSNPRAKVSRSINELLGRFAEVPASTPFWKAIR